jgi:hypothetical protein
MKYKKHIIIYSHGFGTRKDDRGLLTDIAASLPEVESILFDYFNVDEVKKEMYICPISDQVEKLNKVINKTKIDNPDAIIDLIAHSQGTVVAAMALPKGIRRSIFLAPVFDMGLERTLSRYRSNSEAKMDIDGISILPPLDGVVRVVPSEYWRERVKVDSIIEYNKFSQITDLIMVEAEQDQLLPKINLDSLGSAIKLISLDGDHNFNHPNRETLIECVRKLII